jgi:hypothetical protein
VGYDEGSPIISDVRNVPNDHSGCSCGVGQVTCLIEDITIKITLNHCESNSKVLGGTIAQA